MPKIKIKGDVQFYKPLKYYPKNKEVCGWLTDLGGRYGLHPNARPIAYSTKATSDLLTILKPEYNSWEELMVAVGNDNEAVAVIEAYQKYNIKYGDVVWG